MRHPFQIKCRDGWHAKYKFADGAIQRHSCTDYKAAEDSIEVRKTSSHRGMQRL